MAGDKGAEDYLADARRELSLADHMVYVTMPLITDRNLFMSAVGHIYNSVVGAIRAFLEYERTYNRIVTMPTNTKDQVDLFLVRYTHDVGIEPKVVEMIQKITSLGLASKTSYTQFKRSDKFVILSPNYKVLTIDQDSIKKYLSLHKVFISKIEERLRVR
jgi:hypothetical protein